MMPLTLIRRVVTLSLFFALVVLMLGAYTRLTDADWAARIGQVVMAIWRHNICK